MIDLEWVQDLEGRQFESVDWIPLERSNKFFSLFSNSIDCLRFSSNRTRSVILSSPAALNVCNFSPAVTVD